MLHQPAKPSGKDPAIPYKMRIGVWMFILYAIIYAGFVALNLISPTTMEAEVLFGMNLAVVYGLGLIIFALILALIYNFMCGKKEVELASSNRKGKE